MLFLLIFSGYWIVYWQEFIILPLFVHDYIDPKADTEIMLITGPLLVIALTVLLNVAMQKVAPFRAITLGTLISAVAWICLIIHPSVVMAYVTLGSCRSWAKSSSLPVITNTFHAWLPQDSKALTWALRFCPLASAR